MTNLNDLRLPDLLHEEIDFVFFLNVAKKLIEPRMVIDILLLNVFILGKIN